MTPNRFRTVWVKVVAGLLGLVVGAVVGYETVRRATPPSAHAGADAITGLVWGVPAGSVAGGLVGVGLGAWVGRRSRRPDNS